MINPPIALFYMQGLNTPVHGHTALFGVYGMLGLGLMLFCLRGLLPGKEWRTWPIAVSFWAINIGLTLMVVVSLLLVGLLQTWAAVEHGTWYARSAEFSRRRSRRRCGGGASRATRTSLLARWRWGGSSWGC